jgi:hypothetical protein
MSLNSAIATILTELIDGAGTENAWILNPNDRGLLGSVEKLSGAQASAANPGGGATIAGHVDHVRYGLELMNRWSQGENPFSDADYSISWNRREVSDREWTELRGKLRSEAHKWLEAARKPRDLSEFELTGVIASAVHLAYHLGAMRQIDSTLRGPKERE